MKRTVLAFTGAMIAAATLMASQASADEHNRRSREGSRTSERSRESDGSRGRAIERAVPRAVAPRVDDRRYDARDYRNDRRGGRSVVVAPRVVRPYVVRPYARPYGVRPYYVRPYEFRPRLRLSIGLFAGYPVPYAYAYPYPVPVYGYSAPSAPVMVGPGSMTYGGVSLEITPGNASVYVDGQYAGVVEDFDGTRQTLTLVNGRHRIDISAPGYEPMSFDVDVYPGQIVPFRGDLRPGY